MSRGSAGAAGLARAGPVFAALGEETRLALVARLCARGPQSITRLATGSDVTRQAITKHLHVLAGAGLVHDVRRGRERIWELDTDGLDQARRWLDQISKRWDETLDRLKKFVED
ncbi:MAG TPA: metalloregulator ArsR/SmtB family transcription factor [Thermoanaerobaculia bacterium]|jgi:DNA-binding transcriptional ArsR family regulator|nr:metalloregulator ArsR/SmtB family transcription factor [Thermoanaerobaculia bacterium]